MVRNISLIEMAKDITIAKLNSDNCSASQQNGIDTALFMEEVYKKLVELNKNKDANGCPKE